MHPNYVIEVAVVFPSRKKVFVGFDRWLLILGGSAYFRMSPGYSKINSFQYV
jgi:hypothetical protein